MELKQAGNSILAIRYRLLAVLCSAIVAALMRSTGQHLPVGELIFIRSVVSIFLLTLFFSARGQMAAALHTAQPLGHFTRGLLGVLSTFAYVAALIRLPLLDVTVFAYSTPIITVVLGALILKERVRLYRWSAVVVGFIGVLLMIWPYLALFNAWGSSAALGALLAILSALTSAGSAIQVRHLTATQTTASIVFYFYVFCMIIAGMTLPFASSWPTSEQWLALVVIGGLGTMTHIFSTESHRHAATSVTASFDYTAILWAFLIGYFFFGELPTMNIVVGGAVVVTAGLFILLRERQLHIEPKRAIPVIRP